ncbi:TetR/AcrR family transcriptional regulator [Shewanella xiamenensis]|uniref:TetR/AcrR family transcriptional regulator n=1 Tax=Shewanella TaxID=22 RepID=UPI001CC53319|nr:MULTISPECIES: TetR/AcrR family transcriptional regulator [Shewanella]MCT8859283.1 TetR/AcrR family transcriptional regulator [Shewanella xiamenensis]MDN5499169.1 TetR/AcrR family transcriptional regulator [Shewanella sp.]MDN5527378.1 TetR/AcrR family transcriptional regulator [Shewanella sp.]UWG64418.1 TetR/AcrR family transcriptional regulator [Shewanella xiamenensis]BDA58833.1 TetR family transcriptional regulator [Shewanella xiamenensis]
MKTETQSTRQHILDVGYSLIVKQGFSCLGLAQLLKTAQVPKGSFYHYFESKEQFGEALLTSYFEQYQTELDSLFANPQLSGFDRQMQYWQRWLQVQHDGCIDQKCLVVKLSAEVADLSEAMRLVLLKGSAGIIERLTQCIQVGITDKSICEQDAQATAELLYHMWLGASLMNKLGHSRAALERALAMTESILKTKTMG